MNITIVNACSDLGVMINGSEKGPLVLSQELNNINKKIIIKKENGEKERDKGNRKRNIKYVNKFNEELYTKIINEKDFVITLGGDHSIAIGSDLASKKKYGNIGLLWIDAHSDYHNMDSTITGNIHGMPFATISGQNGNELSYFFDGEYYNPKNTVLIGARDIEAPEYINLEKAGVKIFTTEDIKTLGVEKVMEEAFDIALSNTLGVHISYDLDVIDPEIAKGVSVKASDGINEKEAYEIKDEIIKKISTVKSFDLVEYNPDNDIDNNTKKIALNILNDIINAKK